MDSNAIQKQKRKFSLKIWFGALTASLIFESILISIFPPICYFWVCSFGWSFVVILILNYLLLASFFALIPMRGWKVVKWIFVALLSLILVFPFSTIMLAVPRQLITYLETQYYKNNYPEIVITNPEPNALFEVGKSYSVTWTTKNIPSDARVGVGVQCTVGNTSLEKTSYDERILVSDYTFSNSSGHATVTMPTHLLCAPGSTYSLIVNYVLPDEMMRLRMYKDLPVVRPSIPIQVFDHSVTK